MPLQSGALDVSVEGLTLVALIHEIAHAYTHLGKDIDGKQWRTDDFANTDIEIVEGLAQYYTEIICGKISVKRSSVNEAFERLLNAQSGPYLSYKEWFDEDNRYGAKEIVRFSLIDCRKNNKLAYQYFLSTLEEMKNRIGRK